MSISLDVLKIGENYDRPFLAKLWGYKNYRAISRGIVTPKGENKIIIFITEEKQDCLTQYADHFEPDTNLLYMEGELHHNNDERLINSPHSNDEIYLFHRKKHHSDFIYMGRIYLASYEQYCDKEPSKYVFSTNIFAAMAYSEICCAENTSGNSYSTFTPDSEGRKLLQNHIRYERSLKNRAEALKIHGNTCCVCGFNFDKFYGIQLASNYIEMHHIKPLYNYNGLIDPKTDLVPVCANCHRMLHRYRNKILSIDELKNILNKN